MKNNVSVEEIRRAYPKGCRLRLVWMDDPYSKIPEGTYGTVVHVDDMGTIHVRWDNGSGLGVIPGIDSFEKVGACDE